MKSLLARALGVLPPLRAFGTRWWERLAPVRSMAARIWGVLTPLGRGLLALTLLALASSIRLGWAEMSVIALAGLLLMAGSTLFLFGRTRLRIELQVEPQRVTVGEAVSGELAVTNLAGRPMLPVTIELPVDADHVIEFGVPALKSHGTYAEPFVVPTHRRGVVEVGPATSVRGDPVGILRRDHAWTHVTEVFVHPKVVQLDPLGAGLMRDLEGKTSENVSPSDLAFHALREYTPGDDLRHVHWRSTARHGKLLVRQFLDTRRSHLNAIVDANLDAYRSEEDYETAISVAASLMVRAILDDYDATFLSGPHATTRGTGRAALDACARAVPGRERLVSVAAQGNRLAPDTSIAVFITGPGTEFLELQRSAAQFPIEVTRVAVRVDGTAEPGLRKAEAFPVLTLGRLDQLPGLLRWGLS